MCCGNCEEFDPCKGDKGFCPRIYWPYDVMYINEQWFCKDFAIAKKYRDDYRVNKKSRPADKCLLEQLKRLGVKKHSAMISDCVMLTSTSSHK